MPDIPDNISRDDILNAIDKIDSEGIPSGAQSSTYDVLYENKRYPPKVVISYANLFANDEILDRGTFSGGLNHPAFITLEKEGFEIVPKSGQSQTDTNTSDDIESCWFVGAAYGSESEDQSQRFFEEGIWVNGYKDKYLELVNKIKAGDKIAIKSSYTRKNNLPFNANGNTVSVMGIKATGIVTENIGDGRNLKVDWTPFSEKKEWYFYMDLPRMNRIIFPNQNWQCLKN